MKDIRIRARERMKGFCRVCPICDGRACAGEVPGMGGLGTAATFRHNVQALAALQLNMRLVHNVKAPSTATRILDLDLAFPVLAAPIGGISFNMGTAVAEGDYVRAVLEGCRNAGVLGCTGDGVPPVIEEAAVDGLRGVDGYGIPYIKPWEGREQDEKLDRALQTGCPAVGMDIDAAGLITLRKMGRPVAPLSPAELAQVVRRVHDAGRRFILKGIMTPQDARHALESGADAIVVSNHGGRVLDHCPGTAAVLPHIVKAVGGRMAVLADGGVRDGVDVLKMLALGADAVCIGRPISIAAVGGSAQGVSLYLEQVRAQLEQAMLMTGCGNIGDITPEVLFTDRVRSDCNMKTL